MATDLWNDRWFAVGVRKAQFQRWSRGSDCEHAPRWAIEGRGGLRGREWMQVARRFPAQKPVHPTTKVRFPNRSFRKSRQEVHRPRLQLCYQIVPIDGVATIQMGPIVQTGPPQFGIVQLESCGTNNPQFCVHGNTGSPDVPGILGNLWLVEHHVC